MAITIVAQPQMFHPIYHPVIWLLDSTIKANDQFRYQIQIDIGAEFRIIDISPRPGDGYGRQNLSQHLKDFLDQDIIDIKQTGGTLTQAASKVFYSVRTFEKYKDVSGNDVIIAGPVITGRVGFNTIFNRSNWLDYDELKWRLTDLNTNLPWNIEQNVEVFKDDIFFIHVLADTIGNWEFETTEYFKNGTTNVSVSPTSLGSFCNLFRLDLSLLLTDPANAIKFCIKFRNLGVDFSKEYCLTLIDGCSRFNNLKFLYLDDMGSYNSLNFDHISRKSSTSAPKTYKKFIDSLSEEDTSREITRYFNNPTEVHTANTDYLTDEHNIMMVDLINSSRVFLDVRNDADYPKLDFLPVEILTRTIDEAKNENSDLAQFQITWRFSFDKIGR